MEVVDKYDPSLPKACGMNVKPVSVTSKKSPNVYKSCPKMISPEKLKILTPLQKLHKNVRMWGDLGELIVGPLPKVQ